MNARSLHNGEAPVYLIHGDEPFIARQALHWLRTRVLAGAIEDFNLDRFDGKDRPDPERIAQAARTLPMMADRRLVLVRNAEGLAGLGAKLLKPLLSYIEQPDSSACLLLVAFTKIKKTTALYKRVAKHGVVFEASTPRERELPAWVRQRFELRRRAIQSDAAALLCEAVGRDLAGLDAAVERLCLFVPEGTVERSHVEQTVSHTRTRTVWELVDAIADRDVSQALARAHLLIGQGEAPLKLLSLVVRQFRQLLIGRSAVQQGASTEAAAAAAGIPSFRARTFARQLDRYNLRELHAALDRLAQTDRALKGSKLPSTLIFESALLDLCAPR